MGMAKNSETKSKPTHLKIIVACIHYPVASGRYVSEALRRMGHDVRTIGPSTGTRLPWLPAGVTVPERFAWREDGGVTHSWPDWTPDLIIVMESAWAYHHPVYSDVPHVVYGVDNHVRNYRQRGIAHYFLGHHDVSIMDMQAEDVTWLPCGYDPIWFTYDPIPWAERQYDVALVGVIYPQRAQALEALAKAGYKVHAEMGALYDEYGAIYRQARISLNVSAQHDLSQRIFETAALGCVVLTDVLQDLEAIDYPAGAIIEYEDGKDLLAKVKDILNNPPDLADRKWLTQHTWDQRAQVIIDWFLGTYGVQDD